MLRKRRSQNWLSLFGVAWSRDGQEVWFYGEGPSGKGIYAVTLSGKQRLVLREPEALVVQDLSAGGRLLGIHATVHGECRVHLSGDINERDFTWLGDSECHALSPDGDTVLVETYTAQKGPAIPELYLRRADASVPVRIGDGYGLALSPDGKWALALVEELPQKLMVLPTGLGEAKSLSRGSIERYDPMEARWLPNNRQILFVGREKGHDLRAYVQDVDGGQPLPITPEKRFAYMPPGLAVSPDGSSVIFTSGNEERFFAYPIGGGEPHAIAGPKQGDWPIVWSADGRSLFVTRLGVSPIEVYRVDIRTGERRLWKTFVPPDSAGVQNTMGPEWVLPTPDGRFYSYSYVRNLSELYLVNGVK